jgi:hypothetical protein
MPPFSLFLTKFKFRSSAKIKEPEPLYLAFTLPEEIFVDHVLFLSLIYKE